MYYTYLLYAYYVHCTSCGSGRIDILNLSFDILCMQRWITRMVHNHFVLSFFYEQAKGEDGIKI